MFDRAVLLVQTGTVLKAFGTCAFDDVDTFVEAISKLVAIEFTIIGRGGIPAITFSHNVNATSEIYFYLAYSNLQYTGSLVNS